MISKQTFRKSLISLASLISLFTFLLFEILNQNNIYNIRLYCQIVLTNSLVKLYQILLSNGILHWFYCKYVLSNSVVHLDVEDFSDECLLCHKEPARSKQKAPTRGFLRSKAPSRGLWMGLAGSLWHKRHWRSNTMKHLDQWEPSLVDPRPMRVDHTEL